jgi:molecular chaperone GrpE
VKDIFMKNNIQNPELNQDQTQDQTQNQTHEQTQDPDELARCYTALKQNQERILYLTAEFDNYRKRAEKQQTQCFDDGQSQVLKEILPIVDNFERAFTQLSTVALSPELSAHVTGLELILKELHKLLSHYRVEELPAHGLFNPQLHEALSQVTSVEHPSGHIAAIYQKGYIRKGQLLRPAQVAVAR